MNPTRLFVLGALSKRGPMHGHQIRRDARLDRAELWSQVKPGSLYGALHRLEDEGLIRAIRTEQDGSMPARTVYEITTEGSRELRALRDEAFTEFELKPDPVDLALAVSADLDRELLRGYIEDRIAVLVAREQQFDHQLDRRWPDQNLADDLIVTHAKMRIRTEIDWHRNVLANIDKLETR
ncbi:PadR family transcriptional regulator [Nocardia australiensis]|uniref:PadR family transcriptional regulator n=1 Tax=Nocardia australiensis TaxID=2887191 RepID=UPI001D14B925|nr:PadR family transcriptional regulator [Nocardia australiensis]